MHIIEKVKECISKNQLLTSKPTLIALSGGVDSVVLAHIFKTLGYDFVIGHANFGLRGNASEEDARFVATLAQQYKVRCFVQFFDTHTYAARHKQSIQLAARHLRYHWFEKLRVEHDLGPIATAHHASDSFETTLYNLTKGTGIAGMRGMVAKRTDVVHPLLTLTKDAIMEYARTHRLVWREDSSNGTTRYHRNLLRHKVLPTLRQINPNLLGSWLHTSKRLQQVEALLHEKAKELYPIVWHIRGDYIHLDLAAIANKPWGPSLLMLWLAPLGFRFSQIQRWWEHPPQAGRKISAPLHWLMATQQGWVVGKHQPTPSIDHHTLSIEATDTQCQVAARSYHFQQHPAASYIIKQTSFQASLDADKLVFPLLLRPWRPGDYLYPLGMQQRKKVSDLLTDHRVPSHHKAATMVFISGQDIVWVAGYRIHEHYKITKQTREVYTITLENHDPQEQKKHHV